MQIYNYLNLEKIVQSVALIKNAKCYKMGKNDITQSKIIAFANALQTTPSYLMGLDEHETEK